MLLAGLTLQPWSRQQYVPLKQCFSIGLQSVISHKTVAVSIHLLHCEVIARDKTNKAYMSTWCKKKGLVWASGYSCAGWGGGLGKAYMSIYNAKKKSDLNIRLQLCGIKGEGGWVPARYMHLETHRKPLSCHEALTLTHQLYYVLINDNKNGKKLSIIIITFNIISPIILQQ
jgi:hypothetical protein